MGTLIEDHGIKDSKIAPCSYIEMTIKRQLMPPQRHNFLPLNKAFRIKQKLQRVK